MSRPFPRTIRATLVLLTLAALSVAWMQGGKLVFAQAIPGSNPSLPDDDAALERLAAGAQAPVATEPAADPPSGIDMITLITSGGWLMWPIGVMSVLVVTLAVERFVSFRNSRLIPGKLVRRLSRLVEDGGGELDAEAAMTACKEHPSATAKIVAAMLLRTGRPLSEIEQAVTETAQREADDHAGPIRWLNLAAAATPLMGLLGTVWGMIVAFHNSATLTAERSRSEQLSEGIYTALVTTLAGLAVAIPAAIIAQYLENRLTKVFHKIERLAFSLAPALEHYVGKQRMDAAARLRPMNNASSPLPIPPPVATRSGDGDTRGRSVGEATTSKR